MRHENELAAAMKTWFTKMDAVVCFHEDVKETTKNKRGFHCRRFC